MLEHQLGRGAPAREHVVDPEGGDHADLAEPQGERTHLPGPGERVAQGRGPGQVGRPAADPGGPGAGHREHGDRRTAEPGQDGQRGVHLTGERPGGGQGAGQPQQVVVRPGGRAPPHDDHPVAGGRCGRTALGVHRLGLADRAAGVNGLNRHWRRRAVRRRVVGTGKWSEGRTGPEGHQHPDRLPDEPVGVQARRTMGAVPLIFLCAADEVAVGPAASAEVHASWRASLRDRGGAPTRILAWTRSSDAYVVGSLAVLSLGGGEPAPTPTRRGGTSAGTRSSTGAGTPSHGRCRRPSTADGGGGWSWPTRPAAGAVPRAGGREHRGGTVRARSAASAG